VSGIFQKCIKSEEGIELLREIHQGECGHHASSRALVAKAFRHGFYWPTAQKNAEQLVKQCNGCQRFSKHRNTPAAALKTIPLTWPFAVWGLDMVGPFKIIPGGLTHLLVAVDKFTKWIEAKPIKKLDGSSTIKFFNDIITRYGVPHSIITDNGMNFVKGVFAEYCGQKGIRLDLASVVHPQTNGQVEKANGLILAGIKPRLVEPLERSTGCWVEELPSVLWSLRTTPKWCCPLISNSMRPELSSTRKSKQKKLVKMASTSSRRHESRLWPDQRSASSSCDDTIAGKSAHSRFAKEISYSG
jgi:hypothetical protein